MAEESKLSNASHIAQIVGLVPAFVCMWAVFSQNNPSTTRSSGLTMNFSPAILVSFVVAVTCFAIGGILQIVLFVQRRKKPTKSEVAEPETQSRLKILWAHYGVDGGPNAEVSDKYLRPRICGNSLAGWVGADLFGGFQPVIGLPKRLTVRYSFDGEEATVVRQEHDLLVLPEDKFLKVQLEACQRDKGLNENQSKADLWRAQESYRQCTEELRESANRNLEYKAQLAVFAPLQIDALSLSMRLLDFIDAQGHRPTPKYTREQVQDMSLLQSKRLINSNDKDYDFACEFYFGGADGVVDGVRTASQLETLMLARYRLLDPWYEKVTAAYNLEFRDEVEKMRNRFALEGLSEDVLLVPIIGKMGRENIKAIAGKLWELSHRVREKGVGIENP